MSVVQQNNTTAFLGFELPANTGELMGLKSDAFGAASIIYLRDIIRFQYLPYSTNTSIKKFCEAFNIPVLGNSRKYVMAIQLFRGCMEARIRDLKSVYGSNYADALKAEMNLFSKYKSALESVQIINNKPTPMVTEKPKEGKHEIEKQFLLDLHNAVEVASTQ